MQAGDLERIMKLWTVWLDYGATGEGRTLLARIACADSEQAALDGASKVFGEFWARCAEAAEGVVDNNVTRALFAPDTFQRVKQLEGRANVDLYAQYHLTFA
jgi:hypothetical protein